MLLRLRLFYNRLTLFTKLLLLAVALDLCAPGWLVFGIPMVGTASLVSVAEAIKGGGE
jgi:hypothetical protein